ncbi:dTDP-4-dehydrorhamnose reductase [Geofilum rhodophaeum]|uniref:dTDP-4-dehydrorhamnose reductase n=1 Tax=Geofilum rhodophaeum TaxID=1965019 RepID=UPI000B52215D|nr:dTDP-4-dehydrorhamnose reductase [Geofilum rhodophaeum]
MMKVLIIGADGQLGSSLCSLAAGCEFAEFASTTPATLDVSSETNIRKVLEASDFNYLVNCTAYTAVDKAESDEENARRINAEAPGWLARCAREKGAGIIHISTDYVFDGSSNKPLHPAMPARPTTVYGQTKLAGEEAVKRENPQSIIIRTSWLYSAYGHNFVKTMLGLSDRGEVNVVFDQVGTPTYAGDLAAAILEILERSAENPTLFKTGTYHFSNLGVCSWYDFAQMIFQLSNNRQVKVNPIKTEHFPTPALRPAYSVMDVSDIIHAFDLDIPYWTDSLQKCLKELRKP